MTLTTLESKLNKAGYYTVIDQDLCEILVANNNVYPNHFRKCYSLLSNVSLFRGCFAASI